jgi:hypothetical protein
MITAIVLCNVEYRFYNRLDRQGRLMPFRVEASRIDGGVELRIPLERVPRQVLAELKLLLNRRKGYCGYKDIKIPA